MIRVLYIATFLFSASVGSILAQAQPATPRLSTIVKNVEQVQVQEHESIRPYEVTREYLFYKGDESQSASSDVVAEMTYYPPYTKEFSIQNTTGSGRGTHVVKSVLEHEAKMAGQWRRSAVTRKNYEFSLLGEETIHGRRCFILGLEPRREATELLEGKAWIDAQNFRILKVQGEPSKSPSFWIKKVQITLLFSDVQGMWLQTGMHAVADVRIFGRHIVSERDLRYRVGADEVAAKKAPRRSQPETSLATFVR